MKPTDLRGILHYIPQFRDQVFILAIDGAIVADDNFGNILLDVAVLRSLNIHTVLVHGAGHQINLLSQQLGEPVSSCDGSGVTDPTTLRIAEMASHIVTHEFLEGLSLNNIRGACTNCIEAVPLGILKGVDYQWTGKVHRVDAEMLRVLLDKGIVPVVAPLGFDGNGHTFRLNSDGVAVEVAQALGAVKLMFISTRNGLEIDGKLVCQLAVQELENAMKSADNKIQPEMVSKAQHALRACLGGVNRVHIINGQVDEGLLAEVRDGSALVDRNIRNLNIANDDDIAIENLRALCPTREDRQEIDIDIEVAKRIIIEPELYARALEGAPHTAQLNVSQAGE